MFILIKALPKSSPNYLNGLKSIGYGLFLVMLLNISITKR